MNTLLTILLPPAKITHRILATLCDLTLIFFLCVFIVGKVWLPLYQTNALLQFRLLIETYSSQIQSGNFLEFIQEITNNPSLVELFTNVDRILFLTTWMYYLINAICFKGGSLGKQIFSLRVLKFSSLRPPNFMDYIFRSGIQTFLMFTMWPFLMCFNLCCVCISPLRRGIHDWFCQTYVVHFGTMEQIQQKISAQASSNDKMCES